MSDENWPSPGTLRFVAVALCGLGVVAFVLGAFSGWDNRGFRTEDLAALEQFRGALGEGLHNAEPFLFYSVIALTASSLLLSRTDLGASTTPASPVSTGQVRHEASHRLKLLALAMFLLAGISFGHFTWAVWDNGGVFVVDQTGFARFREAALVGIGFSTNFVFGGVVALVGVAVLNGDQAPDDNPGQGA